MSKQRMSQMLRQQNNHKEYFEKICKEETYCEYSRKIEENIKMIKHGKNKKFR